MSLTCPTVSTCPRKETNIKKLDTYLGMFDTYPECIVSCSCWSHGRQVDVSVLLSVHAFMAFPWFLSSKFFLLCFVQSSDPADKDAWKDKGTGQLSIKCKEGVSKCTRESKPTVLVRNDVCFVVISFPPYKFVSGWNLDSIKHTIIFLKKFCFIWNF